MSYGGQFGLVSGSPPQSLAGRGVPVSVNPLSDLYAYLSGPGEVTQFTYAMGSWDGSSYLYAVYRTRYPYNLAGPGITASGATDFLSSNRGLGIAMRNTGWGFYNAWITSAGALQYNYYAPDGTPLITNATAVTGLVANQGIRGRDNGIVQARSGGGTRIYWVSLADEGGHVLYGSISETEVGSPDYMFPIESINAMPRGYEVIVSAHNQAGRLVTRINVIDLVADEVVGVYAEIDMGSYANSWSSDLHSLVTARDGLYVLWTQEAVPAPEAPDEVDLELDRFRAVHARKITIGSGGAVWAGGDQILGYVDNESYGLVGVGGVALFENGIFDQEPLAGWGQAAGYYGLVNWGMADPSTVNLEWTYKLTPLTGNCYGDPNLAGGLVVTKRRFKHQFKGEGTGAGTFAP